MEWCQESGCPAVWEDDWELNNNSQEKAVRLSLFLFFLLCFGAENKAGMPQLVHVAITVPPTFSFFSHYNSRTLAQPQSNAGVPAAT